MQPALRSDVQGARSSAAILQPEVRNGIPRLLNLQEPQVAHSTTPLTGRLLLFVAVRRWISTTPPEASATSIATPRAFAQCDSRLPLKTARRERLTRSGCGQTQVRGLLLYTLLSSSVSYGFHTHAHARTHTPASERLHTHTTHRQLP